MSDPTKSIGVFIGESILVLVHIRKLIPKKVEFCDIEFIVSIVRIYKKGRQRLIIYPSIISVLLGLS